MKLRRRGRGRRRPARLLGRRVRGRALRDGSAPEGDAHGPLRAGPRPGHDLVARDPLRRATARVVAVDQHEFTQHFPKPGWVEHDAEEIWETQLRAARGVLANGARHAPRDVAAIGITNQRETTVVWDRADRRSRSTARSCGSRGRRRRLCEELRSRGLEDEVRARTGLVIDAYFSAHQDPLHPRRGARRAGSAPSAASSPSARSTRWLLYKLTGGRVHATEPSNASRTMLYDIHARALGRRAARASCASRARCCRRCASRAASSARRDPELARRRRSRSRASRATSRPRSSGRAASTPGSAQEHLRHRLLPADEHRRRGAALEERACSRRSRGARGGQVEYALEGSVFVAGAAVQWLRDGLGLRRRRRRERGRGALGRRTPAASTWCRPSSGSARRTGTSARAARSSGSRAARRART